MTKVHFDVSMSLDGFITGPDEGVEKPLGDDDGRLHDWMFDARTDADAEVLDDHVMAVVLVAVVTGAGVCLVSPAPGGPVRDAGCVRRGR